MVANRSRSGVFGVSFVCIVYTVRLSCGLEESSETQFSATTTSEQFNRLAANVHYLFVNSLNEQLDNETTKHHNNQTRSDSNKRLLFKLLDQIGPDMRPASGFEERQDVDMALAQLAWRSMHKHAELFARERVDFVWPLVRQTLIRANVSSKCLVAAEKTARAARSLKTWAVQLLNSWANFPAPGIFEGTLGDVGSFHGCLNVEENEAIQHAHYCTISYKPILPSKHKYELVVNREPGQLLNLFPSDDSFSQLLKNAQYNHYVYYKFGACFPIDCSPIDAQKFARLLGRQAYLLSGPVKCHSKFSHDYEQEYSRYDIEQQHNESNQLQQLKTGLQYDGASRNLSSSLLPSTTASVKLVMSFKDLNQGVYIWKPHMTTSQLIALVGICSLTSVILLFTLADLILNRIPKIISHLNENSTIKGSTSHNQVKNNHSKRPYQVGVNEQSIVPKTDEESDPNNNNVKVEEGQSQDDSSADKSSLPLAQINEGHQGIEQQCGRSKNDRPRSNSKPKSLLLQLVDECSLITNTCDFFTIGQNQLKSDILCMNGLRCITMSWIILAHTIQYNDWSAFARIYEVEAQLLSWSNQPIFNASYLVDTFFVMSGLLTSYTVFRRKLTSNATSDNRLSSIEHFQQVCSSFSPKSYLIGRYLRLTPQILLVTLIFILLPLSSSTSGPHWVAMTGEYSENCSNNWWINLLHLEAFYKSDEMCNFVCWWISVDMFYHLIALALILVVLKLARRRLILPLCTLLLVTNLLLQANRHYQLELPPNLLSTIPQVGAMWNEMTLAYFWTPIAHFFPFMFAFYLGFIMASHEQQIGRWFNRRRATLGWFIAIGGFIVVLFSTHWWLAGLTKYSRLNSTIFALCSQMIWSFCVAWTIFACQFGHANFINKLLSCRFFIVLSRASYLVYLSHFAILFTFFGSQNLLLEPTRIMIIYIILGNISLSMLFGSILCIAFELPWLKIQKRIMRHI